METGIIHLKMLINHEQWIESGEESKALKERWKVLLVFKDN